MIPQLLIRLLIRIYTFCVIIFDILNFISFSIYEICLSIIKIIRPNPKKLINNEIVLIVGAGRGIGREFAIQISLLGAIVICLDINSVDNKSTVKTIRINGGKAYYYTCDITIKENLKNIMTIIKRDLGITVTMMFHCCGIPTLKKYSIDPLAIQATINLNILSYFWLLDEILPDMKKYKHGHIIFISSMSGVTGKKHQMPITVGQFAIQGIFESILDILVKEQLHNNIYVTMAHIYPFIRTKLDDNYFSIPTLSHCFGEINPEQAVKLILDGVLRNKIEFSIPPKYIFYLEKLMNLLPRRVKMVMGDYIDIGVDYNNVQISL